MIKYELRPGKPDVPPARANVAVVSEPFVTVLMSEGSEASENPCILVGRVSSLSAQAATYA